MAAQAQIRGVIPAQAGTHASFSDRNGGSAVRRLQIGLPEGTVTVAVLHTSWRAS
jgi:hypothetical protein